MEKHHSTFGGWNREARHTLLLLGMAIGIPAAIAFGIVSNQTGLALVLGPVAGLALGVLLSLGGRKDA